MVKYFKTTITPPFKKGESVEIYCKAVQTDKGWTVCMVHTDTNVPFMTVMNDVQDSFFKGVEEITKNFYVQQVLFISNLCG